MSDPFRPRVVIGMPNYGDVCIGAARSMFLTPVHRGDEPIVSAFTEGGSSFLPGSFNTCLIQALEQRDAGQATHFAMIHADIEPEHGWVSALWKEMKETGAMLVSAVTAIKNHEGKTSTAIGLAADPWAPIRHIMIEDRNTLPTTFAAKDVCEPGEVLLINTGLWLTDLRHPFWDTFPGFDTHSRIERDKDGKRVCRWRTEDWELSRLLHAAGCDYRATWSVMVQHIGKSCWPNY